MYTYSEHVPKKTKPHSETAAVCRTKRKQPRLHACRNSRDAKRIQLGRADWQRHSYSQQLRSNSISGQVSALSKSCSTASKSRSSAMARNQGQTLPPGATQRNVLQSHMHFVLAMNTALRLSPPRCVCGAENSGIVSALPKPCARAHRTPCRPCAGRADP